ncbi:MAG: hypothetical protein J6U54_01705 [Clostridiales bacterium]|nr:hypothetical protein [Clostridiales bacterium]
MLSFIAKHGCKILTASGILGYLTSTVLSVRAYEKTKESIRKRKAELGVEKLSKKEVVKTCWKHWVWPVLAFATSTTCIIAAEVKIFEEKAALAAAYKVSEAAYNELREQTRKEVSEEKFQEIEKAVNQKKAEAVIKAREEETQKPVTFDNLPIYNTSGGNELWFYEGILFRSSKNFIISKINELNYRMRYENYILENELLFDLEIPVAALCAGAATRGWNVDQQGYLEPVTSEHVEIFGQEFRVLSFLVLPTSDYR